MAFIETSALNASNVDIAFRNLVTEIYRISKAQLLSQSTGLGPGGKTSSNPITSNDYNYAEGME